MSTHFLISKRLFARLLVLMFVFSLFHVKTATNLTEQEESLTRKETKCTFNNYSARNPAAADSTSSPAYNPSRSNQRKTFKDKNPIDENFRNSLRDVIEQSYCFSSMLKSFLPSDVEITKNKEMFQLKFNSNSINYEKLTNNLYNIYCVFVLDYVEGISLVNLPLNEINGHLVCRIMNDHPELDKFSVLNCFFDENEDEFYQELPILSLSELDLSGCDRIEEILEKNKAALEILQLTNNLISLDFSQLTELLKKFTNLKKLTLDSNEIGITGFEVFFEFVFSLKGLAELNLVNDGVVDPFLRLLSEKGKKVSSSLETLTLREQRSDSTYQSIVCLAKLKLKTLCLTLNNSDEFYNNLSTYLSEQETLERIINQNSSGSRLIDFRVLELITERNIVFDLGNIYNSSFDTLKNVQQLSKIANLLVVWNQNIEEFNFLLSSVGSLPNLLQLGWESEDIDIVSFLGKTPNLESLAVQQATCRDLLFKKLFNEKTILPKLKEFKGFLCNSSVPQSEYYLKDNNFDKFLIANPTIKILKTDHAFLFGFVRNVFSLTNQATIGSIEELTTEYDGFSPIDTLLCCLQLFPNIKKLQLTCVAMRFSDYTYHDSIDQMGPTKIEELFIRNPFYCAMVYKLMEKLYIRIPNIKILSLEELSAKNLEIIIDCFKYFPYLTKLEMNNCRFQLTWMDFVEDYAGEDMKNYFIQKFIQALSSLKYLAHVRIKLSNEDYDSYREELAAVVLPFSKKKIILEYQRLD